MPIPARLSGCARALSTSDLSGESNRGNMNVALMSPRHQKPPESFRLSCVDGKLEAESEAATSVMSRSDSGFRCLRVFSAFVFEHGPQSTNPMTTATSPNAMIETPAAGLREPVFGVDDVKNGEEDGNEVFCGPENEDCEEEGDCEEEVGRMEVVVEEIASVAVDDDEEDEEVELSE